MVTLIALAHIAAAKPNVKLLEAAAVATWFARCVGQDGYGPESATLQKHGWADTYGVPIYLVTLRCPGKPKLAVHVDASSGDVVFASLAQSQPPKISVSAQTDAWLERLGRRDALARNPDGQRYDAVVSGHPVVNLNGYTYAMFQLQGSNFAWYQAPGALPPAPVKKPTLSRSKAIASVVKAHEELVKNRPEKSQTRAELGVFYDERARQSRWVWKVMEGNLFGGEFHEWFTGYVDALSGRTIDDQYFQNSRFMYHSRTPRIGLRKVSPVAPKEPLFILAAHKLRELGRGNLEFSSFEIGNGLRMTSEPATGLEIGGKGELLAFRAPASPGKPSGALATGRRIILAQHPHLPEGEFREGRSPQGNYQEVYYRQRAFGYDYLGSKVVALDLGRGNQVARFELHPAASRPAGLPRKLLTRTEIERISLALAQRRLGKSTAKVRYFATTGYKEIGWYVDPKTPAPVLAYGIEVWMMEEIKNWSTRGSGREYHFDAVTGRLLDGDNRL